MSSEGRFEIEETDIARLVSENEGSRERVGWVNVGAHAVKIELDAAGNLKVEAYPKQNESPDKVLAILRINHLDAMGNGAVDDEAPFKVDDVVAWNDPDEGISSGTYTIKAIDGTVYTLSNEHGSTVLALEKELQA